MTAQTLTLTTFLLDRIAEEEAVARAASHQKVAGPSHGNWIADSALLMANGALERVDREHIARWDPARVLAECAAKRRIVESASSAAAKCPEDDWPEDGDLFQAPLADQGRWTLRALASVYADHPLYREEWAL